MMGSKNNFEIRTQPIIDNFNSEALYEHLDSALDWRWVSATRRQAFLGLTIGSDSFPDFPFDPSCNSVFQTNDKVDIWMNPAERKF